MGEACWGQEPRSGRKAGLGLTHHRVPDAGDGSRPSGRFETRKGDGAFRVAFGAAGSTTSTFARELRA